MELVHQIPMSQHPFVSVIIPARNEEENIGRVLDAIADLEYPRDRYEVIVLDNCSSDATATIAQSKGASVYASAADTVAGVRNCGALLASGEFLAFVDADCLVPAGWLLHAMEALKDSENSRVGVVGNVKCSAPKTAGWVEKTWAGIPLSGATRVGALATSSFIMSRRLFENLGGFEKSLSAGEDDDLSRRVVKAGYVLLALPECTVTHLGYPNTLFGVTKRQMWHGRGQLQTARGPTDRLLMATHIFGLMCLVGIIGAPFFPIAAGFVLMGTGAIALGGAFLKCEPASAGSEKIKRKMKLGVIMWFFLLGRSLGLLRNYFDMVRDRLCSPAERKSGLTSHRDS